MSEVGILRFKPILKSIVWGGRNMVSSLNRELPTDGPYGESWEISDLDQNQSVVENGDFAGTELATLLQQHPLEMLGTASLLAGRFPLLFKFIDASQTLSVQVHPDSLACTKLKHGARPKTEAWYIIDCKPGSIVYVGLKRGTTKPQFEQALTDGSVEKLLYPRPVSKGDYIFLPSGTVHAIGEGILLAEVQQSSMTTYRVFDWNRLGLDGTPRELHIHEALESIHFGEFEQPPIVSPLSGRPGVRCDYFSMETVSLNDQESAVFSSSSPVALMCTAGEGQLLVSAGNYTETVSLGQTVFVPASISETVTLQALGKIECVVTLIPDK